MGDVFTKAKNYSTLLNIGFKSLEFVSHEFNF